MTEQDCQSILTKLIKHEHFSRLKPPITLKLKNIRGSWEHDGRHSISISKNQLNYGYYYGVALVVHEFSHVVVDFKHRWKRVLPHGKEFKKVENRLLKLFGLTIKRKKAYAIAIYKNNKEVWKH